jgi:hypothetical protein
MGSPGPTIAGGNLFVGSGHFGELVGMPGNVLLAFSLECIQNALQTSD